MKNIIIVTSLVLSSFYGTTNASGFDPHDPMIRDYIVVEALKNVSFHRDKYTEAEEWMGCQYDSLVSTGESFLSEEKMKKTVQGLIYYHKGELDLVETPFRKSMYDKAMKECGGEFGKG